MDTFDRQRLKRLVNDLIEVAYPPRCAGCGLRGRWVCHECLSETPLFADPRCRICSMPNAGASCDCRALPDRIDRLWVAGPYEGWLKAAVYSFKFNGETARAPHLVGLLSDACAEIGRDIALAPVPLHPKRKRQRGYDQTALLANRVAMETGQPVFTGLEKVRNTPHQVGLSAAERSLNLLDAFAVRPGLAVPERVVLIDDVATTGATLTECAIALHKGGATSVSAVVIAHGL
jgi:competence protein ComFC